MKLLEQVRNVVRVKHYSYRTEQCYVSWIEQFLRFSKGAGEWRHPRDLGAADVEAFLTDLAVQRRVSASTQNQALNAVVFLYRDVLQQPLGNFAALRAVRRFRVPTVLSIAEVAELLAAIDRRSGREPFPLMARLMYGAGLRLMECCRLRVKDLDFQRGQLTDRESVRLASCWPPVLGASPDTGGKRQRLTSLSATNRGILPPIHSNAMLQRPARITAT